MNEATIIAVADKQDELKYRMAQIDADIAKKQGEIESLNNAKAILDTELGSLKEDVTDEAIAVVKESIEAKLAPPVEPVVEEP